MSKSKLRIFSVFLCAVFAFSSFGITAQAESTSELRSERERIQRELNSAQDELDELAGQKSETEEYLTALRTKINLLQDKIDSLESDKRALQKEIDAIQDNIVKTEDELEKNQREIDKKQAEFDKGYEDYCQRLRAMYVSGSVSNLEVLLTCTDMSAMLTRSQMIKSVSEQDSEQLDDLMKKMEEIEAKKKELEVKRNELKEDKQKLEENKQTLQKRIDEIDSSKQVVNAEAEVANALMIRLNAQSQQYTELIDINTERMREIDDEIRRKATSASTGSGSGSLGYPTDSRSISAGYPNYNSGGYHGGIDFPVPQGSNIYAAADGTVIIAKTLNYSYGYYLLIDHGDGLSTLYAHNSALYVGVGDTVSRGQVIAASGNTGNSSGPHCHFEVRVNGSQVNPFNYL